MRSPFDCRAALPSSEQQDEPRRRGQGRLPEECRTANKRIKKSGGEGSSVWLATGGPEAKLFGRATQDCERHWFPRS